MRRPILVGLVTTAAILCVLPAGLATAHPLGNFSVNHLTQVKVSSNRVDARYILDQAEIPTFQERNRSQADVLTAKGAEVARNLSLVVDGHAIALTRDSARISFPPGQGGLKLTRVELALSARVSDPRRVELRDETFSGRPGWKAIVALPGRGTAVRSSAPSNDPTGGLRSYPKSTLQSPLDERSASFAVRPGGGTLTAPRVPGGQPETTNNRSGDGFAGVFSDAAAGDSVLILLLLAAFGWGAVHALSPGHGKAMVAAYLIGARGTSKHALGLGATVTFTHTIGVFTLGFITLALSQYILPEDLYPWLNLVSGLLVVAVGLGVLRSRIRWARERRAGGVPAHGHSHHHGHDHPHEHAHGQTHDHGHSHDHGHVHSHGGRPHSHDVPDHITWKGLIGMGAAAGLIPCPSALVVLLGAIAQHQIGLGLILILAFSLGLATTLTVLGLTVVHARRVITRLRIPARLTTALPAASAAVIVGVGVVLTAQAVPQF
jgi:nickel/cobalt exporter